MIKINRSIIQWKVCPKTINNLLITVEKTLKEILQINLHN
jgi:hypothetical protein